MEYTINKTRTIYGYDDIYKWFVTNPILANNGHNEYRYNNVLFILKKEYLHIRIYSDNTKDNCVASSILPYDTFAIEYDKGWNDILLLSRNGDKVTSEMYICIKGVIAGNTK
ncbi:MAG: hypothetical protein GX638_18360 [Crenarchaeota archaeon]|nr:hypothetical protein [Thermoproteota archaeon]